MSTNSKFTRPFTKTPKYILSHQVSGGTALDAVVKAVKVLEYNKWGNAGRGSVLSAEGRVKMDASVVNGG